MSKAQKFILYILAMIALSLGIWKASPLVDRLLFTWGEGLDIHIPLGWSVTLGTALATVILVSAVAIGVCARRAWSLLGELNGKCQCE